MIWSLIIGILMICCGLVYGGLQIYRYERGKKDKPLFVLALITAALLIRVGIVWTQEYTTNINVNTKRIVRSVTSFGHNVPEKDPAIANDPPATADFDPETV